MKPKKKQARLPEEIGMYVDSLRAECPSIEQVWLLRPGSARSSKTQWELLAFADAEALQRVRSRQEWHRPDVTVLVVTDGDSIEPAWGSTPSARLSKIAWRIGDADSATYLQTGVAGGRRGRERAVRVR